MRASRPQLREFKVHKNLLAAQSDDEGSTVDARVYSVPPAWVHMVDDMNRDISQIKIKISELQTTSGKALLPGFADDDDSEEVIAATVQEISGLFKECERRLKEMSRAKSEGGGDEVTCCRARRCPPPRLRASPPPRLRSAGRALPARPRPV